VRGCGDNVLTEDQGTGDPKRVGTIKRDPKTKYLDWNVTSPEAVTMLAIYEIKDDEWKIDFGNDGARGTRGHSEFFGPSLWPVAPLVRAAVPNSCPLA
jgi:hypothetical protein